MSEVLADLTGVVLAMTLVSVAKAGNFLAGTNTKG